MTWCWVVEWCWQMVTWRREPTCWWRKCLIQSWLVKVLLVHSNMLTAVYCRSLSETVFDTQTLGNTVNTYIHTDTDKQTDRQSDAVYTVYNTVHQPLTVSKPMTLYGKFHSSFYCCLKVFPAEVKFHLQTCQTLKCGVHDIKKAFFFCSCFHSTLLMIYLHSMFWHCWLGDRRDICCVKS